MSESRLSAIEAKRAKLEELRRQRQIRKVSGPQSSPPPTLQIDRDDDIKPRIEVPIPQPRYVSASVVTDDGISDMEKVTYEKGTQTVDVEEEEKIYLQPSLPDESVLREKLELEIRLELGRELESATHKEIMISESNVDEERLAEFVGRSLKIVDKTLLSDINILTDYQNISMADYEESNILDDPITLYASLSHELINEKSITSFDWCPFNSNLIAVSYSNLPPQQFMITSQNKGLIIIWNIKTQKPEFIFTAQTEILTVKFALHKRTILFAGGYNGKILQYDITSNSRLPISQSPLSINTHSHPVYSILQINTTNTGAGNLVTCSTDGKICQWSPFLLDKPISTPLQLKTTFSRYDEDIINSMVRLSNGSLLLGGNSLTLLENIQTKNNFKIFDSKFKKIVTGLAQFPDVNTSQSKIICSSVDSIGLYNESGEILKKFSSSSIIMDIAWLNTDIFVAGTGLSLELFDITKMSNYSFFHLSTNEYINKVSANDGMILAGTENGNLLLFKFNK